MKTRVLIIGGVATGPKTAARVRRLDPHAEITILEKGDMISYGSCGLPYHLAGLVPMKELTTTAAGLVRDIDFFRQEKNVAVITGVLAEGIDRNRQEVIATHLGTGKRQVWPYDRLVLATGSVPIELSIPGTDLQRVFSFHHPHDVARVIQAIRTKEIKRVAVIGAGLIGLEVADALAGQRLKVTLLELQPQVLPRLLDPDLANLLQRQMGQRGVDVRTGQQVLGLEGDAGGMVRRVLTTIDTIDTDMVIIAAGVRPNVHLAREAGLALGTTGAIAVDACLRTSDPAIFAGGDCVENLHLVTGHQVYLPLASTANKHGRVMGDNIAGRDSRFPGVLGTTALQAFDLNIGRTGLSTVEAEALGYQVVTAVVPATDTSHYFPMRSRVIVKVIAEACSRRLLGAQVLGAGDAIKRLDVLATALAMGCTLDQLANLDLAYAPPFASAMDIALHATNTLRNKLDGLVQGVTPAEAKAKLDRGEDLVLLDLRQPGEIAGRRIEDQRVLAIPSNQLRARLMEIPQDKEIITLCELGLRGYEAARTLLGAGFTRVAFLEGGLEMWPETIDH